MYKNFYSLQERPIKFFKVTRKTIIKGLLLGVIALLGSCIFTLFFIGKIVFIKYQTFLDSAQISHSQLISTISSINPDMFSEPQNFLILGVDKIENRPNFPQLTDTILLVQIDPKQARLNVLSLPRDLWSDSYTTKINALYEYGRQRQPENPELFPQKIISEITDQKIDYTIIISLDQLAKVIDLFGCITINVEEGFTDNFFPRSDVDISVETDPAKLYETIEFKPGIQTMDSKTAIKYIRSRNSNNLNEGNDLARAKRQQQVILAIIQKLSNPKLYWYYPELAGGLIKLYDQDFAKFISLTDMLSILKATAPNAHNFSVQSFSLGVYPEDQLGVIEHPKSLSAYQQQWVYIVKNEVQLKEFIKDSFSTR